MNNQPQTNESTRVVNVKHDECDVYIGRAMPGRKGSLFANPFRIGPDGSRDEVLAKHRAWIASKPELLEQLHTLKGKRLGCWCKPAACHGDYYVELLDGRTPTENRAEQPSLF